MADKNRIIFGAVLFVVGLLITLAMPTISPNPGSAAFAPIIVMIIGALVVIYGVFWG